MDRGQHGEKTMSRSITATAAIRRAGAVLALSLLGALLLAGQAGAEEGGGQDTGPSITATTLSPASLPPEGGTATVTATVEDDFGVSMAYAQVYGPDGIYESVQMFPFEVSPTGVITFAGLAYLPPNLTSSPVSYGFEIQAADTNGAYAYAFAGQIQVDAAEPHPCRGQNRGHHRFPDSRPICRPKP
jgi:hypothetical protein